MVGGVVGKEDVICDFFLLFFLFFFCFYLFFFFFYVLYMHGWVRAVV